MLFFFVVFQECHDAPGSLAYSNAITNRKEPRQQRVGGPLTAGGPGALMLVGAAAGGSGTPSGAGGSGTASGAGTSLSEEWFTCYDGTSGLPILLPDGWAVIRNNINFFHVQYAVEHDTQSRYESHEIKLAKNLIVIKMGKAIMTTKSGGSGKVYTEPRFSWLNRKQTIFKSILIGIDIEAKMIGRPLNVSIAAAPAGFNGSIFDVKTKKGGDLKIGGKVTSIICICLFGVIVDDCDLFVLLFNRRMILH